MNDLNIVKAEGEGWHLRFGPDTPTDPEDKTERVFKTITAAKQNGYHRFGLLPMLYVQDAVPFNASDPVHAAMQNIEQRCERGGGKVLLIGKTHYWVQRTRLSVEQPIAYKIVRGQLRARNDFEDILAGEMSCE